MPAVIEARPIRTARIANASALVALIAFVIVALLMRTHSAGADFGWRDQVFTVVLGLVVAGGLHLPARPRLRADESGVHTRAYLGDWRTVPWEAIEAVEFPSSVRFARLRLAGEDTLALYAVQRADREESVAVMKQLRGLLAASRPA